MNFKILRTGSSGPQTELLQYGLRRAGHYDGGTDGIFGSRTLAAVLSFQRVNGLAADGIVGTRTWHALYPYLTGFVRRRIRRGDTVFRLAQTYGTTVEAIETANPGLNPLRLQIGSSITVPLAGDAVIWGISFTSLALELSVAGLAARYPFIRRGSIGTSVMGKSLQLLEIGSGPREVFYNGTHHANEWIVTPVLLRFVEEYARAYSTGGSIYSFDAGDLFSRTRLSVVPMVDPDGADLVTRELNSGRFYIGARDIAESFPQIPFPSGWKANILGTDLNLQYPAGWENARQIKFTQGFTSPAPRDFVGTSPLSAPESKAVYDFTQERDFKLTMSYHTQGEVIYWRYLDYDVPRAFDIGLRLAQASGYALETTPSESGYAGYKDWFILRYDRPGYTVEAGLGASPLPISQLGKIYDSNLGLLATGLAIA